MAFDLERALRLWREPVPDGAAAVAAFATVYADPVLVNGAETPLEQIVERARMVQAAIEGVHAEVHRRLDTPTGVAFAFHLRGRHVGPLATPAGTVAPTGQAIEVLGMDLFTTSDDRVTEIWAIADLLGALAPTGALVVAAPG